MQHPQRSDELESILLGIARIRRAHIELLRAIGPDHPKDADSQEGTWGQPNVAPLIGTDEETAGRLLADLASAGFMTMWPAFDFQGYTVNSLGITLLEVLERYASGSP